MTKIMPCSFIAILLGVCLYAAPAQAQLSRTFVSGANGNDSNDCNRLTPCRTFQGAHDKTNDGGEIMVLDPGAYGNVTITKSINIVNDGVGEASMFVSGGNAGVTINAGDVRLRGLTINGNGGSGGNGIVFNSGRSLTIENCIIRKLGGAPPLGNGILFQPSGNDYYTLAVSNTVVANNAANGILVAPAGWLGMVFVKATFNRVEAYNNATGIALLGPSSGAGTRTDVMVVDSVVAQNSFGFTVTSSSSTPPTSLMLSRSVAANNTKGVWAVGPGATVRVGQSTVTGNYTGWGAAGGAILQSYGDNSVDGNLVEGTAPVVPKK